MATNDTTKTQTAPADKKRDALYSCEVMRDASGVAVGLSWAFRNGKAHSMKFDQLAPTMQAECLANGFRQKCNDSMAIARSTETGQSATDGEKYAAFIETFERVLSGQWNAERDGNGGNSLLLQAIARVKKLDVEKIRPWFEARSDDEKKALRKNPAIAKAIAELQAANASDETKATAAELLKGLDDLK